VLGAPLHLLGPVQDIQVTSTQILEALATGFSVDVPHVRRALELLDAGLSAPYIGRCRRAETGNMPESIVRRVDRRRHALVELDRRRATILRMFDAAQNAAGTEDPAARKKIEACMDRFELEDLFVPHRRPEPEVQLAIDRGLDKLADELVVPRPKPEKPKPDAAPSEAGEGPASAATGEEASDPAPKPDADETAAPSEPTPAGVEESAAAGDARDEPAAGDAGSDDASPEAAGETRVDAGPSARTKTADAPSPAPTKASGSVLVTPELARMVAPYVDPDKGIHTESEALSGAVRILSDRLGRNARLRGLVRRTMRKQGQLTVRPTTDESKLGRHRSLLKLKQPLRQIQGHRLLAIRQAQKERALTTVLKLDPSTVISKIEAALCKHPRPEVAALLKDVALKAFEYRLVPVAEADVRLEIKERADEEALRFLAQHLRQLLLTPPLGRRSVAGLDVNAKGDWTVAALDEHGAPVGEAVRVVVGERELAEIGKEVAAVLEPAHARAIAIGHGKGPRSAVTKLRRALEAAGCDATVLIVNEAGVSSYANSERARKELPDVPVPTRMAISLGRRLQDPMLEILKVDPRHLGLGSEQGLVSKANSKRVFRETIESCVAHVGCIVNEAPALFLEYVPGLDKEAVGKILARRAERPIESREELRSSELLTEAQWTSAISFLRVPGSDEPLDRTSLHPDQYDLARRIIESSGGSVAEQLGRPGVTKGLRRVDFSVDEYTWRDLMREISFPGRDPRPRLHVPELLHPDADRVTLTPGRVIEGVISNVASFGAFVDIGLEQDGMIHISEISDRYVRDARELLSIGQVVRLRLLDASGQRVGLSLKKVPAPERGRRSGGRGGGPRGPKRQPNLRAAQERRDGLMPGGRRQDERRGGGRGRGGPGRGGPGRGGPGGGRGRGGPGRGRGRGRRDEEAVRPEDLRAVNAQVEAYNPFASFFGKDPKPEPSEPTPPAKPDEPKAHEPAPPAEKPEAPPSEDTDSSGAAAPAPSAATEGSSETPSEPKE